MIEFSDNVLEWVIGFLFLIPGFITYQVALFYGKISPDLDRFQQTAWSLVGSGVSLSVTFLSGVVVYNIIWSPETYSLPNVGVIELIIAFPVLLAVALSLGYVSGRMIDGRLRSGTTDLRETTWRYTKSRAEEPIQVRVHTKTGVEILGEILNSGSSDFRRDLLLKYPYRVQRSQGKETDRISIGRFAYVPEEDIAHIYFESEIEND
ncbi:DUF6338 family protein [Halalkaliarchaeum sp. AArc-GB]|uniref:DUF6338 family protein n=1 Tax=Halalkaliarchaeum sp. AArc-GB TaxID=3074078 RepID=UPI002854E06D|nr:DUF6338 family protein [Halalkaliarchaeum sp. AArc-GB]MDR5673206.1 DUF6338 family protein [Halalkaliarchaeum sp. AArc-GB]